MENKTDYLCWMHYTLSRNCSWHNKNRFPDGVTPEYYKKWVKHYEARSYNMTALERFHDIMHMVENS